MDNQLLSFLKSLENISFATPTDSDIEKLQKLSSGRLPAMFIAAYSKSVPADDVEDGDFIFYGIDRIFDENTDYVPGTNLLPLGLFTFSSTFDGDSICFDMNDSDFPVYQCSHSLLSGEDDISYYKGEMYTLPFNYQNVIKGAPKLADSFEEFVIKLQSGEAETFSVTDMIERL